METNDPIYLEMMLYYDKKSENFDDYWNRKTYLNAEKNRLFLSERDEIDNLAKHFGKGNCIDIACGTSRWLAYYHNNCSRITFVDQSNKMLAIAKSKAIGLNNSENDYHFIESDIFKLNRNEKFDCAVVGNFLGHLSDQLLENLFELINDLLIEGGELFIADSLFHEGLTNNGISPNILSIVERKVDTKEFKIYKRFFTREFIEYVLSRYGYEITSNQFWGKYFFGLIGIKNG